MFKYKIAKTKSRRLLSLRLNYILRGVINTTAIERVISIAKAEVGYLEKVSNAQLDSDTANAGKNNWTKYARDLDKLGVYNGAKNGYDWCCVFAHWCFISAFGVDTAWQMLNQSMGGYGASCTWSAQRYMNVGQFHSNPQVGDQIFFTNDKGVSMYHTGIVTGVDDTFVYTVEGNTSSAAGVVANGGAVGEKRYYLDSARIGGYGRPNYSLVEEDEEMDVERFKELFAEMRKSLQDNDAGQWSEEARQWAVATGLIEGDGSVINDEANYMWGDILTREQLITVLYRFARMLGVV